MNDSKNIIIKLILLILLIILLFFKNTSRFTNFNDSLKNENSFKSLLYNGSYWDNYRLGDVVLQDINSKFFIDPTFNENVMYHIEKYPNSIASKYLQKNKKINRNYDLLIEIINELKIKNSLENNNIQSNDLRIQNNIQSQINQINIQSQNNNIILTNTDLVLHIRIGDIMCDYDQGKRAKCFSKIGNTVWWEKVIDYINSSKITNVYIIAGAHFNKCLTESLNYLSDRVNFLKNYNLKVELITDKNPDETIIFCSQAAHFISTGGGYGNLIGNIVKKAGGNFVLNTVSCF